LINPLNLPRVACPNIEEERSNNASMAITDDLSEYLSRMKTS